MVVEWKYEAGTEWISLDSEANDKMESLFYEGKSGTLIIHGQKAEFDIDTFLLYFKSFDVEDNPIEFISRIVRTSY